MAEVKHGEKKIQHFNESDQNKLLAAKHLRQGKCCEWVTVGTLEAEGGITVFKRQLLFKAIATSNLEL